LVAEACVGVSSAAAHEALSSKSKTANALVGANLADVFKMRAPFRLSKTQLFIVPDAIVNGYNHQGHVNSADHVVWRKELGADYTQYDLTSGDATSATAGSGTGAAANAAAPEPAPAVDVEVGGCLRSPATPSFMKNTSNSSTRETVNNSPI
jgi:hypothetical protein